MNSGCYSIVNKSETGCNVHRQFINHLMYADDGVLIAPSPKSLQQMINICEKYADKEDIRYNPKKCVVMCVKPKTLKTLLVPNMDLQENNLCQVKRYQYLRVIISQHCIDNDDIIRLTKTYYMHVVIRF